jgi:hypothetical protein
MSTTNALAADNRACFVDVELHVLPLLDAVEWMARASYKLAELDAMARLGGARNTVGSEFTHTGDLVAGVAWVAGSLLRRYQDEIGGTAVGGAI